MKSYFYICLMTFLLLSCNNERDTKLSEPNKNVNNKEVLLVGTFHYNNPGADVAKTKSFDILNEVSQLELENISKSITQYNPTKVFVEWPYDEQRKLDSLYQLHENGQYFINDSLSKFYRRNEIFQLAFRVAKANNLETVYGIDYKTTFPFGEVMEAIEKSNQSVLKSEIEEGITTITEDFDNKIDSGASLVALTNYVNSPEMRYFSNHFHNNLMLLAGETTDFSGPLLTSEWFKRNLYMWSLIQKQTAPSDERIMVLVGSSHAAMLELFIDGNRDWDIKELQEIMGNEE